MRIEHDKLSTLLHWIDERHKIWYRRFVLQQEPPFTEDVILDNTKFTNVFRDLDRGTLYYNNVLLPKLRNERDLLLNTVWYRLVNRVETMDIIGTVEPTTEDLDRVARVLQDLKDRRVPVFTSAYQVNSFKSLFIRNKPGMEPHQRDGLVARFTRAIQMFIDNLDDHVDSVFRARSPAASVNALKESTSGIGKFTAFEVWCDLAWNNKVPWSVDDYVTPGRGARDGIDRIFPGESKKAPSIYYLRDNQDELWDRYRPEACWKGQMYLSLKEWEHALCEFSKYQRRVEGKPSAKHSVKNIEERTASYLQLFHASPSDIVSMYLKFNPDKSVSPDFQIAFENMR